MTNEQIEELQKLAEAATPGPWTYFPKPKYNEHHVSLPIDGSGMRRALFDTGCETDRPEQDARFIAAANPAAIKELIKDRARQERLFLAACDDLAAIADDLGINSHVEGGAAPIMREIAALRAAAPSPAVQQPAEGGWTANTGVQPVADDVKVDVELGNGRIHSGDTAAEWCWDFVDDLTIVRWRPAAPTQAEGQ